MTPNPNAEKYVGNLGALMPKVVPINFENRKFWTDWQRTWFYKGLLEMPVAKEGIDVPTAMKHLSVIQRSFSLKHEEKEEVVAYLASLWFEHT